MALATRNSVPRYRQESNGSQPPVFINRHHENCLGAVIGALILIVGWWMDEWILYFDWIGDQTQLYTPKKHETVMQSWPRASALGQYNCIL